jgi:hypothetical protein
MTEMSYNPVTPEIAEEIDSFIARRSEEGGEPTDF